MERIIEAKDLDHYLKEVDVILDVRSPDEFAHDHMPGAINVPVLTNQQREEVGTMYAAQPFEARMLGATYATAAIHEFLKSAAPKQWDRSTRLMVYCARGGQRSGSLSLVLSQIGFLVWRLRKGYKTYRHWILEHLSRSLPGPVYVLYGYTGSGKTRMLKTLEAEGQINILDLEGLASHRGSLLGSLPGRPQPTQRAFETNLAMTLRGFDPSRPTLIEGESRKVGKLAVPDPLWLQMKGACHLWLDIPRSERVRYILDDYRELCQESLLRGPMDKLSRYLPGELMEQLFRLMAEHSWPELVDQLLEFHYDPLYARPLKHDPRHPLPAKTIDEGLQVLRSTVLSGDLRPSEHV